MVIPTSFTYRLMLMTESLPQGSQGALESLMATPRAHIVVVGEVSKWLAVAAEIAHRREASGGTTRLSVLIGDELFSAHPQSPFELAVRLSRPFGNNPIARLKRALEQDMNLQVDIVNVSKKVCKLDPASLRRRAINLQSEAMSMVLASAGYSLLQENVKAHMVDSWNRVFCSARDLLAPESSMEPVVLFNGRFLSEGAVRAAALHLRRPVFAFDFGNAPDSFALYKNHVHDYPSIVSDVEEVWRMASEQDQDESRAWMYARVNEASRILQRKGHTVRLTLAVFTSSSDELVSIDEQSNGTDAGNQRLWILNLLNWALVNPEWNLVIRVHPNTATKHRSDQEHWDGLARVHAGGRIRVIPAASKESSYGILASASHVLTFGSTMTAEASLLGKPVAELGSTHMSQLGLCDQVSSIDELGSWLRVAHSPLDTRKVQSIKYGHWLRMAGIPFQEATFQRGVRYRGYSLSPFGSLYDLVQSALGGKLGRRATWLVD